MIKRTRGRPRKYDRQDVLEKSMHVFWEKGYRETSIEDLVDATGVGKQSLYSAFGDKRAIFIAALETYCGNVAATVVDRLKAEGTALDNIRGVFAQHEEMARRVNPTGCLVVNSQGQFLKQDKELSRLFRRQSDQLAQAFAVAISRGQDQGNIDQNIDSKTTGRLLSTLVTGTMVGVRAWMPASFVADVNESVDYLLTRGVS